MESLRLAKFILFSIFVITFVVNLSAQESDINAFMNRASQYYLGTKDEILIKVNVWGYVQKPGQYLVPRYTDLISLISFAGGPKDGANLSQIRIIREGSVNKGNNGNNSHSEKAEIMYVNVKNYLDQGETSVIPGLEPGDTVLISQSFGHKFSKFLGVTSVVGLIAATATLIFAIERL